LVGLEASVLIGEIFGSFYLCCVFLDDCIQLSDLLPRELFTVYWVLKEEQQENPEETSEMKQTFEDYPYWGSSEEHERKLKQQIIKILNIRKIDIKRSVELTNQILTILKGPQK
jgi:hypothetical protein